MFGRDTIDRVRARIDLAQLIGESVKLTRKGRSWVGLCPFHQEKSPSFNVAEDKGIFHCFGCKITGDAFKFVELTEGVSFAEALKKLAERAGIELDEERSVDRTAEMRAKKAKDDLYAIHAIAAEYFEQMLRVHPLASFARDELLRRGLAIDGDAEPALRAFKMGYAPHGWDGLATEFRKQGVSPAQAEATGLLVARPGSGHYDGFRHRLMVAVMDLQGRVIAFSGRALADPDTTPRDPPPKYVNSRESSIYAKGQNLFGLYQARSAIRTQSSAIVVEGNFDLVAMVARGIEHVVAPLGTAFTLDQAKLLRRFTPEITLLFDNDAAGNKATWAARQTCQQAGLSARAARIPAGKDPDEFLQSKGVQALKALLQVAPSLDERLIDEAVSSVGQGSHLAAKKAVLERVQPLLEGQELTVRDLLGKRAAAALGIDVPTFWRMLRGTDVAPPRAVVGEVSEEDGLCRAIVETLLSVPELVEDPSVQEALALVSGDYALTVMEMRRVIRRARQAGLTTLDTAFTAELLAQLPPAIHEIASARLASPTIDPIVGGRPTEGSTAGDSGGGLDPLLARRVLRQTGWKLAGLLDRTRMRELEREVDRAEAAGDFDRALALALEKNRLVVNLRRAKELLSEEGN